MRCVSTMLNLAGVVNAEYEISRRVVRKDPRSARAARAKVVVEPFSHRRERSKNSGVLLAAHRTQCTARITWLKVVVDIVEAGGRCR